MLGNHLMPGSLVFNEQTAFCWYPEVFNFNGAADGNSLFEREKQGWVVTVGQNNRAADRTTDKYD